MPYLIKTDLYTHLYEEIIEQITREDDDIVERVITSAINEAKYYLSKYDLLKLFGDEDTAPEVVDSNLQDTVKHLACWKLVSLGNPNINLELFRTNYEDAIKMLEKIQAGKADPPWPRKPDDPETDFNEGSTINWTSNPKRTQHF